MRQADPLEPEQVVFMERAIRALLHASQCRGANCRLPACPRLRGILNHAKICKSKANGDCRCCKLLTIMCSYHAIYCQETNCLFPFCLSVKQQLQKTQNILDIRL